jgi:hypothetical protein
MNNSEATFLSLTSMFTVNYYVHMRFSMFIAAETGDHQDCESAVFPVLNRMVSW